MCSWALARAVCDSSKGGRSAPNPQLGQQDVGEGEVVGVLVLVEALLAAAMVTAALMARGHGTDTESGCWSASVFSVVSWCRVVPGS